MLAITNKHVSSHPERLVACLYLPLGSNPHESKRLTKGRNSRSQRMALTSGMEAKGGSSRPCGAKKGGRLRVSINGHVCPKWIESPPKMAEGILKTCCETRWDCENHIPVGLPSK